MANSENPLSSRSASLALLIALIMAASLLYYHQGLFMPRVLAVQTAKGLGDGYSFGNDFYQVWLTSRQALRQGTDLYSAEMTREIQIGLYGRPLDHSRPGDPVDRRVFPYPAFTDLLFWPASEFPFPLARIVFLCLLATLTIASVPIWLRVLDWRLPWKWTAVILLLTLSNYPALEALFVGQVGLLVAFLLAATILALQRRRFLLAGFLMALTTIKPQVTALAIFYLLLWSFHDWRERRHFCIGLFSTLTLLVGASLTVSPHWIRSWTHTVLAYRHYTRPPLVTEVLTSALGPHWSPPATFMLTAASILIAIVIAWRNRGAASNSFAFCLTLSLLLAITTITILPGQAVYDHLILLPGILLLARSNGLHERLCWADTPVRLPAAPILPERAEVNTPPEPGHPSLQTTVSAPRSLADAGPTPRILLLVGALVLFWPWIAAFALILLQPFIPPAIFYSTAVFSLPLRTAASLPFAVLALLAWTLCLNPLRVDPVTTPESA